MKQTNKKTLVFIHGAWHGSWCWAKFFIPFFQKKYETYCIDLIDNNKTNINKISFGKYSKKIQAQLKEINGRSFIICHSMGSCLVLDALSKLKVEPAGVIFLFPVPIDGALKPFIRLFKKYPINILRAFLKINSKEIFADNNATKRILFSKDTPDKYVEYCYKKLQTESVKVLLQITFKGAKNKRPLNFPSLTLSAESDLFLSQNEALKFVNLLGSDYYQIDDIGHDAMLDNNWKYVAVICEKWIEDVIQKTDYFANNF